MGLKDGMKADWDKASKSEILALGIIWGAVVASAAVIVTFRVFLL